MVEKHRHRQLFITVLKYSPAICKLSDDIREAWPKSAVTSENIESLIKLIASDLYVTYDEIETSLHISRTCLYYILNDHLKVLLVCSQ